MPPKLATPTRKPTTKKPVTVKASDPVNVTGTALAKGPTRIPTCDVLDDVIAMGMSSPADEAPKLQIFEIDLEFVPNLKVESGTMAVIQRRLASVPEKFSTIITLVVGDTGDNPSPELEDPKRGLLVNVPVAYTQSVVAGVYTETPVPANIALYARCAAGRFQEDANDLIRVTDIKIMQMETRELIYSM